MTFYIRKRLGIGAIRFSVAPKRDSAPDASDLRLSTGPDGEYRRLSIGGLYFSDENTSAAPPPDPRGGGAGRLAQMSWKTIARIAAGVIFLLLGLAAFANDKAGAGTFWILIALAILVVPFVLSAKKRREERLRLDQERSELEAIQARNREIVGDYESLLQKIESADDPQMLATVRHEREHRKIPYEMTRELSVRATLRAGFRALDRIESIGPKGVATAIDQVAATVGLIDVDIRAVKRHIYQKALWHLLADDRLSPGHEQHLEQLREAFGLTREELELDYAAVEQFRRVDGMDVPTLPEVPERLPLRFQEVCHHVTEGVRRSGKTETPVTVQVTSKRVIVGGKKAVDIPLHRIFDINVDVDEGRMAITAGDTKLAQQLTIPDPVYTGAIIQIAAGRPRKPAGLV